MPQSDHDPDEIVAELLAPLRDAAPETPSAVSVRRAVRTANRRRRFRQAAGVVAAGVVTVLVAVAAPVLTGGHRDVPVAAGEFDVLSQVVTVGSAGGYTPVSYETGRHRQIVRLRRVDTAGPAREATVTVFAPGRLPERDGVTWRPGDTPAPEVNERRAYWSPSVTGTGTEIAWEWTDGAWAFAMVPGTGEETRSTTHLVAQSVAPGAGAPVRVPFTVPTPVDGTGLLGVITPYGSSTDLSAGALLVLGDERVDRTDRVLVGVRRRLDHDFVSGAARLAPAPNASLTGKQAAVTDTAVTIFEAGGGWSVVAEAATPDRERLTGLASSVQLSPEPTTPFR